MPARKGFGYLRKTGFGQRHITRFDTLVNTTHQDVSFIRSWEIAPHTYCTKGFVVQARTVSACSGEQAHFAYATAGQISRNLTRHVQQLKLWKAFLQRTVPGMSGVTRHGNCTGTQCSQFAQSLEHRLQRLMCTKTW